MKVVFFRQPDFFLLIELFVVILYKKCIVFFIICKLLVISKITYI
jgi:hypothetical protein